jgi:glutamate-ammonia-ligase adenylyltransferase
MSETAFPEEVTKSLEKAWNPDAAASSMEHWLTVCRREGWGPCPQNLSLLTLLFGASWYFTRLVFFRGQEVTRYFDEPAPADYSPGLLYRELTKNDQKTDLEQRFDLLRLAKNELMLRIFLSYLRDALNQEQMERALTNLAETSLQCAMELLWKEEDRSVQEIAVLAMGRMAGGEMNFGSDLDLIFLYSEKSGSDAGGLMRPIRMLLRHIALPAPSGILYEIDMRLRPHGTSGTLISPVRYFIEYHSGEREIWERQMMTRCRPVVDRHELAAQALAAITPCIYAAHEPDHLRTEILHMRKKVQSELGSPQGKYEIKRGSGGIMDIDFLTHYLQLRHGHEYPGLRTPSTRSALRELNKAGFIDDHRSGELLVAYDFLKRLECVLRVADLKNVSAFSTDPQDNANQRLSRAMGYLDADRKTATERFMQEYLQVTRRVRVHFTALVGNIEERGTGG